jgi:uncharacterized protein YjiS (DUF1127 family)
MHTISSTECFADLSARPSTSWRDSVRAGLRLVALWRERARQRHALASLDARLLRDIGITPYDAACECNKPFWR